MKMLLATHKALLLWENGRELVLHTGEGVYYGITWSETEIYVVARGNEPSRMRVFTSNMMPLDGLPFVHLTAPDDGPHQAFWRNGTLYVTNTQRNRVEMWNKQSGEVSYLAWGATDDDHDHINSIWYDSSTEMFWVVEHRKEKRPKRFRVLNDQLKLVDTIELDLDCLVDGPVHSGLHNVYVEDDMLYSLGPSQLIQLDLHSNHVQEIALEGIERYKHYLRGFARLDEKFFIGVSNAHTHEERGWGRSSVLVLDNELCLIDKVDLSPQFGQLMEIRLVDKLDWAHNEIMCPLENLGA